MCVWQIQDVTFKQIIHFDLAVTLGRSSLKRWSFIPLLKKNINFINFDIFLFLKNNELKLKKNHTLNCFICGCVSTNLLLILFYFSWCHLLDSSVIIYLFIYLFTDRDLSLETDNTYPSTRLLLTFILQKYTMYIV